MIQPLNIESVIIRGQTRVSPVSLPELREEGTKRETQVEHVPPPLFRDKSLVDNRFRLEAGTDSFWNLSNSLRFDQNGKGTLLGAAMTRSEGWREGTGSSQMDLDMEIVRNDPKHPAYSLSLRGQDRDFELPAPFGIPYSGSERDEQLYEANFRMDTPWVGGDRFSLLFEGGSSKMENDSLKFDAGLFRGGVIYNRFPWSFALSIERDRREKARSLLTKFFFRNIRYPVDETVSLHWGLGFFAYSSDKLIINEKDERGASLYPYIRLDVNPVDDFAVYLSYASFYEHRYSEELFFSNPLLSEPSSDTTPEKISRIETGGRLKKGRFDLSLSAGRSEHDYRPVYVRNLNDPYRRLVVERWRDGIEYSLEFEGKVRLTPVFNLTTTLKMTDWNWRNRSIKWTSAEPDTEQSVSLVRKSATGGGYLRFRSDSRRKLWPTLEETGRVMNWDLRVYRDWNRVRFYAEGKNLADDATGILPDYDSQGRHFLLGLFIKMSN